MAYVDFYIKFLKNNVFITLYQSSNSKVLLVRSTGTLGFKNKAKSLLEGFNLLLVRTIHFSNINGLKLNMLSLDGMYKHHKYFILDNFNSLPFNTVKIVSKISHNGCRLKKVRSNKHSKTKLLKHRV
jgi:hypothetical protein